MSQDYKVCEWCNNALDFGTTVCPFCGKSQMSSYQFSDNQNQWKQGISNLISDELKNKISKFVIIWVLLYFLFSMITTALILLHGGEHRSFLYNF